GEGRLWIATRDGLDIFDPVTRKIRHLRKDPKNPAGISGNYIRTLYQDSSGRIWLGTRGDGLNLYDPETDTFRVFRFDPADSNSLGSSIIQSVCESPLNNNLFWIGTDQGITRFDLERMEFQRYRHDPGNPGSLGNNTVMCMYQPVWDPDLLWVCTYGGGLNRLRISTGEWTYFTEKDGLPGDLVYAMLEERDDKGKPSGVFWLSTGRGLSRFDSRSNTFNNFGLSDGIMVSDFNYGAWHYGPDGRMYFGGTGGLMEFNPKEILTNQTPPSVFITSFKVFDQEMLPGLLSSPGQRFEMNYRRNFFSFEFAALDYSSPAKNLYAYKMEGIDPDWVYRTAARRDATYTSVPPGEYRFRVRASNSDGVWNEEGAALSITVEPPFWQTGWFITIAILAAAMAILSIYRWRVSQLTKRKKILEELVNERTYQLDLANRELQKLATQDYLTGIANHRRFSDFLRSEWKRAIRQKKPISIILIDVDDFKMFNDTYGHQAGDECLKRIAQVLDYHCRRPSDLAARYGGEEFIIILADTPLDGAIKVAEVMKKGVEDLHIPHESSRAAPFVTISLGCSTFHPTREDESMMLIHAADAALYQSKKEGRNRISVGSI
ncbi:MAG: diguanylate cyclase, partial [Deltaproteobacteria bacterium]|nr:diguanylate cyclase [Deltaproteobacteria bacterium]